MPRRLLPPDVFEVGVGGTAGGERVAGVDVVDDAFSANVGESEREEMRGYSLKLRLSMLIVAVRGWDCFVVSSIRDDECCTSRAVSVSSRVTTIRGIAAVFTCASVL